MTNDKEYTVEDVVSSRSPEEVEIPYLDGKLHFRIDPLSHRELGLLRKHIKKQGKDERWDLSNEILLETVERKKVDGDGNEKWVEITKKELGNLPPGLVVKIMDEVNQALGMDTTLGELQNLSSITSGQEE